MMPTALASMLLCGMLLATDAVRFSLDPEYDQDRISG